MTDHPAYEVSRADGHIISDDRARLQFDRVHGWIAGTYWAAGIPAATLQRAIDNSLTFGLYAPDGTQRGFARVTTDRTTFGYLQDVFVDPAARGSGLGVWLCACIFAHPDLQGLRRMLLATRDAMGLYQKFGFSDLPQDGPTQWMHRTLVDPYRKAV